MASAVRRAPLALALSIALLLAGSASAQAGWGQPNYSGVTCAKDWAHVGQGIYAKACIKVSERRANGAYVQSIMTVWNANFAWEFAATTTETVVAGRLVAGSWTNCEELHFYDDQELFCWGKTKWSPGARGRYVYGRGHAKSRFMPGRLLYSPLAYT